MLETLVSLLPAKWQDKAKGLVVALGSALGILTVVWDDAPDWLTIAVTVATALGVYAVPNVGYGDAQPLIARHFVDGPESGRGND